MVGYTGIAEVQLHQSIELFFDGDFISSITLAGAAEEILGKMLDDNVINSKQELKDIILSNRPDLDKKHVGSELNKYRNALKHYDKSMDLSVLKECLDKYAYLMIARAINNYQVLRDGITTEMSSFYRSEKSKKILASM